MVPVHTSAHVHRAGLVLSHVLIVFLSFARASVFITHPYTGISCSGGEECAVTWADDGQTPLLAAVGSSDFALFQGTNTLVQQLATGLDVSQTRELSFVPNPIAGPKSNSYWIKLTSVSARDPNNTSQPYTSFSGFFSLDNMSGVEGSPVASLASPLPSSSTSPAQGSASSSETNGVVGTTTLSNVIPTGSASALSSALSAISSAASGSLGTKSTSSSRSITSTASPSATSTGSATGTSEGSNSSGTSNTSYARGKGKELKDAYKISITLIAILLGTQTSVISLL